MKNISNQLFALRVRTKLLLMLLVFVRKPNIKNDGTNSLSLSLPLTIADSLSLSLTHTHTDISWRNTNVQFKWICLFSRLEDFRVSVKLTEEKSLGKLVYTKCKIAMLNSQSNSEPIILWSQSMYLVDECMSTFPHKYLVLNICVFWLSYDKLLVSSLIQISK